MRKKYHGTVSASGTGIVYEDWYGTRHTALRDLKREARETVLNSFDGDTNAGFTLSFGGRIIAAGHIPGRRFHRHDIRLACSVYGLVPVKGTRIC